jgi:hypothetical protein
MCCPPFTVLEPRCLDLVVGGLDGGHNGVSNAQYEEAKALNPQAPSLS